LFAALALFGSVLAPTRRGVAAGPIVPSWIESDTAAQKVRIDIIAGWNANNAALNFNGYYEGNMTLVVPVGWGVEVDFVNRDGDNPHSIVVTQAYAPDQMPEQAGREDTAIKRAYTRNPTGGIAAGETDSMRFKMLEGNFYFFCGVHGHGIIGMWTRLDGRAGVEAPFIEIAEGADAGRE